MTNDDVTKKEMQLLELVQLGISKMRRMHSPVAEVHLPKSLGSYLARLATLFSSDSHKIYFVADLDTEKTLQVRSTKYYNTKVCVRIKAC